MNARCHISKTKRSHSASPPLANEWIGFISGDLWRPAKLGKEKREECEQRLVGRLSDCNNLAVANSASVMQETSSPLACSNVSPAVPQKKRLNFLYSCIHAFESCIWWFDQLIMICTNSAMSCKRPHLPTLKCQPSCATKKDRAIKQQYLHHLLWCPLFWIIYLMI